MNQNIPKKPPVGWKLVTRGIVQRGDRLWTPEDADYTDADPLDVETPVNVWKAVIRKEGK